MYHNLNGFHLSFEGIFACQNLIGAVGLIAIAAELLAAYKSGNQRGFVCTRFGVLVLIGLSGARVDVVKGKTSVKCLDHVVARTYTNVLNINFTHVIEQSPIIIGSSWVIGI